GTGGIAGADPPDDRAQRLRRRRPQDRRVPARLAGLPGLAQAHARGGRGLAAGRVGRAGVLTGPRAAGPDNRWPGGAAEPIIDGMFRHAAFVTPAVAGALAAALMRAAAARSLSGERR